MYTIPTNPTHRLIGMAERLAQVRRPSRHSKDTPTVRHQSPVPVGGARPTNSREAETELLP